jgi:hypothetical protein
MATGADHVIREPPGDEDGEIVVVLARELGLVVDKDCA